MADKVKKRKYPKTKPVHLPPELVDDALTALEQTGLGSLRQFVRNCLEALKKDPVGVHYAVMSIVNPDEYPPLQNRENPGVSKSLSGAVRVNEFAKLEQNFSRQGVSINNSEDEEW